MNSNQPSIFKDKESDEFAHNHPHWLTRTIMQESSTIDSSFGAETTTSSPLEKWKLNQQAKQAERERESEAKHKEIIAQASADIEAFYAEYNKNKELAIAESNAEMMEKTLPQEEELTFYSKKENDPQDLVDDPDFWDAVKRISERIKKPKNVPTRDVSRMRELIASKCTIATSNDEAQEGEKTSQ